MSAARLTGGAQPGFAHRGTLVAAAMLVLAAVAAYHNSFDAPFVFDDHPVIRENPTIRTLWPVTIPLSPPADSGVGGRPLANLSLALNYAWTGTHGWSYHAVNLLLHTGTALLLFGVVRRTLGLLARAGTGFGGWSPTPLAFSAALVWLVHPLATASVTYLAQRTELLMGFFYLLTFYSFVRGWSVLAVVACALGMLSKEVMVTAPVLLLLFDRAFMSGSVATAWRTHGRTHLGLAGTWLILAALLTTGMERRSVGFGLGVAPLEYAFTACEAVLVYLQQAVWPAHLVFDYGRSYNVNPAAVVSVVLLLSGAAVLAVRRPRAGFLLIAPFLLLAPTTSFVPVAEQPIAENRMYLPLAALGVAGTIGAARLSRRGPVVVLMAALGLGVATVARNDVYRSELGLWRETTARRPANARAHYNRGVVALQAGLVPEAVAAFERAVQVRPDYAEAHNALGNAWLRLGRSDAARREYAEAVRIRPEFARAWYNYGTALLASSDAEGARRCFERALDLQPCFADAENNLGNVHFQLGRTEAALGHYRAALQIEPALVDAHYNAGSACLELGRVEEAVDHLAAAVRLKPGDPEIRNHLGAALARAGNTAAAIREFEQVLTLQPDHAEARHNLALLRAGTPAR